MACYHSGVVIGETLGNYTVVEKLGAGGMGVVYAAEHNLLGRKAAIKLLLPELSRNKDLVDRFFNEARAATMVRHAGIIDVFDFGFTEDGSAYIAMEFLDGQSLSARISESRLDRDEDEVVRITRQVANALAAAHAAGIVHRDLKPDNIFLVPDSEVPGGDRVKILDFGIAKLATNQAPGTSKTQTGQMMGSPLYMAPEQCKGAGEVDARADIYSLGCVMYEMTCRRPVFDGGGVGEVIAKQIYETPVPPRSLNPELSEPLEAIILRTLAKRPEDRFVAMADFIRALDEASGGRHVIARGKPKVWDEDAIGATVAPSEPPRPGPRETQTTLGSAAAELTESPGSRSQPSGGTMAPPGKGMTWVAVAAALVVIGGGASLLALRGGGGDRIGEAAGSGIAARPAPTDAPVATDASPPIAPIAEMVTVTIESEPSGAEVFRVSDGIRIGVTPFREEYRRSEKGSLVLLLKHSGYKDQPLEIPLGDDRRESMVLKPTRRGGTRHGETKPPAVTKPPEREPPVVTKPPELEPPETKPPETKPPAIKPPVVTKPPETKPPEIKPPKDKEWGKTYNPLDDGP